MLIWEIILFGMVLPIVGGVILGYTGRTALERDKMARALELRRALVAQIHETQNWHELAELIVTTPGNVVPANRTWLLAQLSDEEEFDQIAHWERPASKLLPLHPSVTPAVCERCKTAASLKGTRILSCHYQNTESSNSRYTTYCLWLSTADRRKSALLIDLSIDRPLKDGQIKVLDDLGDEMSLAIDNASLHYVHQRQVDLAKNERQRIARDLHDTLGQNISYLRLKLEQLSDNWPDSRHIEFQDDLSHMLMVADKAYNQVRDTLEELRTTGHQDLEQTLRLYAAQAAERAGFTVAIHSSGQPEALSARKSRQIMYILREAMNNVEIHARAQNVDIHLQWSDEEFLLTVHDDGKGFHPEKVNKEDKYGLSIMGERARAINANLCIDSTPGQGAELTLSIPLSSNTVTLRSQ
jgi:signal transduction histidine kinase